MNYMKTLLKGFEQSRVQSLDVGNFYYVLLILTIPSDSIQYLDVCLYDLVNVIKSKVNNVIINTVTREMTYLKYINSEHIRVSLDIHPYEVLADTYLVMKVSKLCFNITDLHMIRICLIF